MNEGRCGASVEGNRYRGDVGSGKVLEKSGESGWKK